MSQSLSRFTLYTLLTLAAPTTLAAEDTVKPPAPTLTVVGGELPQKLQDELLSIAQKKLVEMNIPYKDRAIKITIEADVYVVTFLCPPDFLGGDFIIKIDKTTQKITDTKIWR